MERSRPDMTQNVEQRAREAKAGVALDRAVRDADKLITCIVDMELAAEAEKPAKSIGLVRL